MTLARAKEIMRWIGLGLGHRGLVLDVGSGNSPHPRSDVICDKFVGPTGHRRGDIRIDRRLVVADLKALPFRAKTFTFSMCRMVMEHIEPAEIPACMEELSRVSKAGYIETPSAICEMLMPDPCHTTFVELLDGVMIFTPKASSAVCPPIAKELLVWRKTNPAWQEFLLASPDLLTVQHRWSGSLRYKVRQPSDYPSSRAATEEDLSAICEQAFTFKDHGRRLRRTAKDILHILFRLV